MFARERDDSWGLAIDQNIAQNNHCIGVLDGGRRKGDIKFLVRGRLNYRQSHAQLPRCAWCLLGYHKPVHGVTRIDQERNFSAPGTSSWRDLYLFGGPVSRHPARKTGDVTAWTREALDEAEAEPDGIGDNHEYNRNGGSCRFKGEGR
jgi:hypothetical protein